MRSLNKVFLMGHLGASPQLTLSKDGRPYTRFSLATNHSWRNKEDELEQKTDWHSVFVWGTLAEQCCDSLKKGALVFVEGSLTYWRVAKSDKEYQNAVQAHRVQFLNSARNLEPAPDMADASAGLNGDVENLDNLAPPRNHNAVAHPA